MNTIQIGAETWTYAIEGCYTNISDPDGKQVLTLRWAATEKEVIAAAGGYGAGLREGERCGRAGIQAELCTVLGLAHSN